MNTMTNGTTITAIDQVSVTVGNLLTSLDFYRDGLGPVPSMQGEHAAEFELADNMTVALRQAGRMPPSFGVAFRVDDARAAAAKFRLRS